MSRHEDRRADLQLQRDGRCFGCERQLPEAAMVLDMELNAWFCADRCYALAQSVRCKPVPGRPGRGRTRPLQEWRALLISMRRKLKPTVTS